MGTSAKHENNGDARRRSTNASTSGEPKPLERVLIATDFSANASRALARVAQLPLSAHADIQLVHVITKTRRAGDLRRTAETTLKAECERLTTKLASPKIGVSACVVDGLAWTEIIRASRIHGSELIVLGPHSKESHFLGLGHTARDVIRRGSSPVLVVRRPGVRVYGAPLVALDLSDASRSVLELGERVIGRRAPLYVIHAYHVPFQGYIERSAARSEVDDFRRSYRLDAKRQMNQLLAAIAPSTTLRCRVSIREGEAARVIEQEAALRGSDLIVVGTHGRKGLSHFVLGSVAQWLLENATVDVLVSRAEPYAFAL